MAASTVTAAELTQDQVVKILTKPLEQRSAFLALGPRIFDTNGSPVRVPASPTFGDPASLTWTGENEQIPEVDADFGEFELLPSTMKSVKVITRYSNELARQSVVALDSVLRDRLVADVAAKLDTQFLGDGGDGTTTPLGLFAYTGVQNIDVAGELTLDTMLAAQGMALTANVPAEGLKWLMAPESFTALRGAKDGQNRYMLEPDATLAGGWRVLGSPVVVTSRVPAGSAALVWPSAIAVARDLAPSVKILTERYADYDQQAIRVVARYDAGAIQPDGIVTLTGITAA